MTVSPKKMRGAQAMAETLVELGVRRVYGIPGAQNVEFFDSLEGVDLETVLVTHELGASFMADAEARLTGRPGVIAVVPGPGLTNCLTGLAEAYMDSVPVVCIASGVRARLPFRYQLHQIDQLGMAAPVCKKVFRVESPEEIPALTTEAFRLAASGEPGPVVIEFPSDLALEKSRMDSIVLPDEATPIDRIQVGKIADRLLAAQKVGLYVGQGVFGHQADLRIIAEHLQAPVATTISGRGALPEDDPLSVGFGMTDSGHPAAVEAFSRCDLVLAVSCKFGEVSTGSYGMNYQGELIHVDINPEVLGTNYEASMHLAAPAGPFLKALRRRIEDTPAREEDRELKELIADHKQAVEKEGSQAKKRPDSVAPERFMVELARRMPRDTVMVTDSGGHMFWAISHFPIRAERSFLAPVDYQSMGYGTPAAVSAAIECAGKRPVVATIGDGCFLMTGIEMLTAVRRKVPLLLVVFRDKELGIIRQIQEKMYARPAAVDLSEGPDFQKLAEGFGAEYRLIAGDEEVSTVLDEVVPVSGPTVLEVRVRYDKWNRYFQGALKANMRSLSKMQILGMGLRLLKRKIFGV